MKNFFDVGVCMKAHMMSFDKKQIHINMLTKYQTIRNTNCRLCILNA